jgi:hypothetical protein
VTHHWGRPKWHRSLLVWSLVAATAAAITMAVYTYQGYQRAASDLVIQRDGQVALLSAARLSAELTQFTGNLYALARTPAMADGDLDAQREALASTALRLVVFDGGVVLLDNHGIVTGATPPRPDIIGSDWVGREAFRQVLLKSDTYVSDAANDGPGGSRVVSISVPILGPNSEFRGALVGLLSIGESTRSSLNASIVRLRLVQSGSIVVTDGTGIVIYSTSPEQVGSVVRTPDLPPVASAPGAGSGRSQDAAGNDVVIAHAPIPSTGWTLITEDDWDILTASTRRYRDLFLASLLLATLLPGVGATILARQGRLGIMDPDASKGGEAFVRAVQRRLSPDPTPMVPGWASATRHRLTAGTQRDVSDMAIRPDGRLMLAVARVEASGIDAVLAVSAMHTLWREAVARLADPCDALTNANQVFCSGFSKSMRVSSTYMIIDPVTGLASYSLAGQAAPIVCCQRVAEESPPPGPPLGQRIDATFDSRRLTIGEGSYLFILSQPMCQARDSNKDFFLGDAFSSFLEHESGPPEMLADLLMQTYDRFVNNSPYAPPEISYIVLQRYRTEEA